jgi:hypothetical protein
MGEFTAKIFTGGAVVFQLSGEHGFQDISSNDRFHSFSYRRPAGRRLRYQAAQAGLLWSVTSSASASVSL